MLLFLAIIMSINLLIFQIGTEPSDNQYLVVDIGLAAVPIIMIGRVPTVAEFGSKLIKYFELCFTKPL